MNNFFKKHWILAVALPISTTAVAITAATTDIDENLITLASGLMADAPLYPGFGGYIYQRADDDGSFNKTTMVEIEPYTKEYLNTFYHNVLNPKTLEEQLVGAYHPLTQTLENHIVAHFEADDYHVESGMWFENLDRIPPLLNNEAAMNNTISAQKSIINNHPFVSCNGELDSITGEIPSIGKEESAAVILVAKAGTGENYSGTYNNIAFSIDSTLSPYSSSSKSKFRLIDNVTPDTSSPYNGYIGYMNGDGNSSTTRIQTHGLNDNSVEVHVMYVGAGQNAFSAYYVNGKPVSIDAKTKTDLIPEQSNQLAICGELNDYALSSDINIAEMVILKDNEETPLPYSLVAQTALSLAAEYGVERSLTSTFTYNSQDPSLTGDELTACGDSPFEGTPTCMTKEPFQNDNGDMVINLEFAFPVIGGRVWVSENDTPQSQLPINRELTANKASNYKGAHHSAHFISRPILILDQFSTYNTENSTWYSQAGTGDNKIANPVLTSTSYNSLGTTTHLNGTASLHCNREGALSSYHSGGVELTDGMTVLLSGQLNNVDPERHAPRGFFNIGEFNGTSSENRGLVEIRHTEDGYIWESSLGGTTEKIFVGDKPFHLAVQFNESVTGKWSRDVTVVTEGGWDKREGLNTNIDRVENDDTVYLCDDGRRKYGEVDISSVYVVEKLQTFNWINDNQSLHKLIEIANSNSPLPGSPIHEPNLKEQSNVISFLKTLRP